MAPRSTSIAPSSCAELEVVARVEALGGEVARARRGSPAPRSRPRRPRGHVGDPGCRPGCSSSSKAAPRSSCVASAFLTRSASSLVRASSAARSSPVARGDLPAELLLLGPQLLELRDRGAPRRVGREQLVDERHRLAAGALGGADPVGVGAQHLDVDHRPSLPSSGPRPPTITGCSGAARTRSGRTTGRSAARPGYLRRTPHLSQGIAVDSAGDGVDDAGDRSARPVEPLPGPEAVDRRRPGGPPAGGRRVPGPDPPDRRRATAGPWPRCTTRPAPGSTGCCCASCGPPTQAAVVTEEVVRRGLAAGPPVPPQRRHGRSPGSSPSRTSGGIACVRAAAGDSPPVAPPPDRGQPEPGDRRGLGRSSSSASAVPGSAPGSRPCRTPSAQALLAGVLRGLHPEADRRAPEHPAPRRTAPDARRAGQPAPGAGRWPMTRHDRAAR